MLTPKQLNAIYNRIKIRYNPSSYSFKDRLVNLTSYTARTAQTMETVDYLTESKLVGKIADFWAVPGTTPLKKFGSVVTGNWNDNFINEHCESANHDTRIIEPFPYSSVVSWNDNLNVGIPCLARAFGIKDFESTKMFEAYIALCYLLTTPKSIASDLKWISTLMPSIYSYENLHNMQYLKDALESRDTDNLYILMDSADPFNNINPPLTGGHKGEFPNGGYSNIAASVTGETLSLKVIPSDSAIKSYNMLRLHVAYMEAVAFGLETAYMAKTYLSAKDNAMLHTTWEHKVNDLTNLIYLKDKSVLIPALEMSDNPEERFLQISGYIQSPPVQHTIENMVHQAYSGNTYTSIPTTFGIVLAFAMNYSLRNIRIHQCAILYNYCKANKLLNKHDMNVEGEVTEAFSGFMEAVTDSGAAGTKDRKKSMLDVDESGTSTLPPKRVLENEQHDGAQLSAMLDGLTDHFKTERYTFNIKEVYSDKEALRDKYMAIASKVKLVNTQLIKQIREIKTYNVGGKYAGLPKGKIDRKNIHKYKTDKNVFYNNTYKQKECDLAIGIVLDASGSMWGTGIENGIVTMIVLHETLKALGINHSIIDHTYYGSKYRTDIRRYQCFKEDKGYKLTKNYALADITAESGNCDSGALWFMEKALMRTKNKDKICLIFSDGAPTACSDIDLINQVRHMEKLGIKVIGIGIGFPNISKYYTDYANGNNLKEMLNITADILKEYVIMKKD